MEDLHDNGMVGRDSTMAQRRKRERDRNFTPAEVKLIVDIYEANKEVLNSKKNTNMENEKRLRVYQRMVDELNRIAFEDSEFVTSRRTVSQVRYKLKGIKHNAQKCWSQYKAQKAKGKMPILGPGQPDWSFIQRVIRIMDCRDSNSGASAIEDYVSDDNCRRSTSLVADTTPEKHPEMFRIIETHMKSLTRTFGQLRELGVDAGGVIFEEDAILCAGSDRLKQLITHPNITDLLSEPPHIPGSIKQYGLRYHASEDWTCQVLRAVSPNTNRLAGQSTATVSSGSMNNTGEEISNKENTGMRWTRDADEPQHRDPHHAEMSSDMFNHTPSDKIKYSISPNIWRRPITSGNMSAEDQPTSRSSSFPGHVKARNSGGSWTKEESENIEGSRVGYLALDGSFVPWNAGSEDVQRTENLKDEEDSQEEQQPSPDPVVKEEPVSPDREAHLPSPDREAHLPSPDRELQQPSADTYSGSQHSMDEDSPTSLPPDAHSNSLSPFSLGLQYVRSVTTQEEQRYSCELCGKRYFYAKGLRQHLETHTGMQLRTSAEKAESRQKNAARVRKWRETLNPQQLEEERRKDRERQKRRRQRPLTEEAKEHELQLAKERNRRYRERKRRERAHNPDQTQASKRQTRTNTVNDKKKEYWRQRKLEQRSKWTSQKWQQHKEACRQRYHEKKSTQKPTSPTQSATGRKPFSCDQCGRYFTQLCSLQIHKRRHSGDKPYVCDLCDESFYGASYLTKHKEKQHGILPVRRRKRRKVTRLTRADDISGREDSHITDSISHSHSSVPTATDSCVGPKPQSTVTGAGTGSQSELTLLRRIINSFEEQGNHGLVCDFRIKNQAVKVPAATSSCEDPGQQSVGGNLTADSEAEMTAARTATNNEQGNQRTVIKVETNHHGDVGVAGPGDQEGVCTDSQAVLAVFPTELSCIDGGKQDKYHTSVIMTGSKDCGGEGTQPHSQQNSDDLGEQTVTDGKNSDLVCKICSRRFFSAQEFETHAVSHATREKFQCDQCGRNYSQASSLKIHKRIHTGEKPYICDVCGAAYISQHRLSAHRTRVHGLLPPQRRKRNDGQKAYTEDTHICEFCSKVYDNVDNFRKHRLTHTKPHRCDQCQKGFQSKSKLQYHQLWHMGVKPFQCHVCGKRFSAKANMKAHLRIHTGEKPYRCEDCGEEFAYHFGLTMHLRNHRGERPYLCDICGASFGVLASLSRHRDIHTGEKRFGCSDCQARFREKTELEIHRRKHTGIQPHVCDVCGQHQRTAYKLNIHKRLHTGEKPYSCTTCGERFARTDVLRQHRRKHEALP